MKLRFLIFYLILLTWQSQSFCQNANAKKWKEDLQYLSSKLKDEHKNLYHTVSEQDFHKAVEALDKKIPGLSDEEIIIELARIVAMVGDGHTELFLVQSPIHFHRFPLVFYFYGDSLYVSASTSDYTDAVGKRVVKINNTPIEKAFDMVKPLISHDNDMEYRHSGTEYLAIPEILNALKITDNDETATFTLESPDGKIVTTEVQAAERNKLRDWKSYLTLNGIEPALYLQNFNEYYWYKYLSDSKTLFLEYNRCKDQDGKESIEDFADEVFEFADKNPVDRFVVDLRNNPGGNMKLNEPIVEGISERKSINQKGKLFVITGRRTFSAALNAAINLKKNTKAIFVGETPRGKPNWYGEVDDFELPNSEIKVDYSTEFYNPIPELGDTDYFPVDIKVENTFKDYMEGKDEALEAILAYPGN